VIAAAVDRSLTSKGQRARARILLAVEPLLATHGFHGTSMRDIAHAASLPLATVVYHFAKKEQLYATLLTEIGVELDRLLDEANRERGRAARIDAFAASLVRWMLAHPQRVKLLLRDALDESGRVARASRLPLAGFLHKAATFIAEGRRAGGLKGERTEYAFLHAFGGLSYLIVARPAIDRVVQRASGPAKRLSPEQYEKQAVAFARRLWGLETYEDSSARPRARRR
jgi:AcrR family transcriptional regulator